LADPNETFRILFNLMSNAVAVANRKPASLTSVTLHVSTEDSMAIMRLADDGPGLPAGVRTRLFRARCDRAHAVMATALQSRANLPSVTAARSPSSRRPKARHSH